jgi:hypothetical protein
LQNGTSLISRQPIPPIVSKAIVIETWKHVGIGIIQSLGAGITTT